MINKKIKQYKYLVSTEHKFKQPRYRKKLYNYCFKRFEKEENKELRKIIKQNYMYTEIMEEWQEMLDSEFLDYEYLYINDFITACQNADQYNEIISCKDEDILTPKDYYYYFYSEEIYNEMYEELYKSITDSLEEKNI